MNTTLLPLKIESIQKDNFLPTYYSRQLNRPFINVFHYVDTTGQLQKGSSDSFKPLNRQSTTVKRTIFLYCQEFDFFEEGGLKCLSHPKWSLTGSGENLHEAEKNLLINAKVMFEGYSNIPISKLTLEAIRFKDFLLSII